MTIIFVLSPVIQQEHSRKRSLEYNSSFYSPAKKIKSDNCKLHIILRYNYIVITQSNHVTQTTLPLPLVGGLYYTGIIYAIVLVKIT